MNREILRLALPSILANITVPIVGMVDLAVAGHLHGNPGAAAFIGGITVGSMIFDLLYWNFGFLRTGTGGLTAQAYGRGDLHDAAKILVRGVGIALILSLIVLLIQWPFSALTLKLVDSSQQVRDLALRYFFVRVWAAPATLSLMTFRGWFIGMQDSVGSMTIDLIVNIVNILASVLLSLGVGAWQGLGFDGVAVGTLVAQYTGLLFACAKVAVSYRHVFRGVRQEDLREAFRRSELRSFVRFSGDLFLRSVALTTLYVCYTVISTGFGDLMTASAAIMMKLLLFYSFFTDGFAYAGEALTGKYIGRRDGEMLRKAVRYTLIWSMSIGVLFMGVYWVLGVPMLKMMTSDATVVDAARQFIPWLVLMPPLGCLAFAWDGIYTGATRARPIRDAMILALIAFLALWFIGKRLLLGAAADTAAGAAAGTAVGSGVLSVTGADALAIHILLAAYFAHLLIRSVYLSLRYKKDILSGA